MYRNLFVCVNLMVVILWLKVPFLVCDSTIDCTRTCSRNTVLVGCCRQWAIATVHYPLTPLYPSQLTCSVTFCFCGVEQGGRHSYSGRSRRPGRWVIRKICNTTLFTILSILSFFANFVEHRRVFSRPEDGLTDVEEIKGVSHWLSI